VRVRDVTIDGLPAEDVLALFQHGTVWVTGYPVTNTWLPADPLEVPWEASIGYGREGAFTGVRHWLPIDELTTASADTPPLDLPAPTCPAGCFHEWTVDGARHVCTGIANHQGMKHRCYCDATTGSPA
jgi:hypothetical protein